jgi:hypothetical protein
MNVKLIGSMTVDFTISKNGHSIHIFLMSKGGIDLWFSEERLLAQD